MCRKGKEGDKVSPEKLKVVLAAALGGKIDKLTK